MVCSFGRLKGPSQIPKLMIDVKVGSLIIPAVIDSGYTQMMRKEGIIDPHTGKEDSEISMVCIQSLVCVMGKWKN